MQTINLGSKRLCMWVFLGIKQNVLTLSTFKSKNSWDFASGPVAKTPYSQCRGPGFTPGQGTRSHVPQQRVHMLQLKTRSSQINK